MSCAIEPHAVRRDILKSHTLIASISLPTDLFLGVITCALVFEAHEPHAESPSPTWFGSWKNDGFVRQKKRGRVDANGTWPTIRDAWIKSYHARASIPGQSIVREVDADSEWCNEAYLETDYAALNQDDFRRFVQNYFVYKLVGISLKEKSEEEDEIEAA